MNDSVDTAEGGSHRIKGGPDIDNESRRESETDETTNSNDVVEIT